MTRESALQDAQVRAAMQSWNVVKRDPVMVQAEARQRVDRLTRLLIWLMWAFAVIPSGMQLLQGRRTFLVYEDRSLTGIPALLSTGLSGLVLACAAILVVIAYVSRVGAPINRLPLFLAPWAAYQIASMYSPTGLTSSAVIFPLIALAVCLSKPSIRVLSTVGHATVLTAVYSLALYVLAPNLAAVQESSGENAKAFFGTLLLAGPYTHSNTLGLALALGAPAITLIASTAWRRFGYLAVAAALVLTASRTAMSALAVAALIAALVIVSKHLGKIHGSLSRGTAYLVAWVAFLGVCLVPLTTSDPMAFSNRGSIWAVSLQYFSESPIVGNGPDFYGIVGQTWSNFNSLAFHGHNLFIHTATTAGTVGIIAVGLFCAAALSFAIRRTVATGSPSPLAMLTVFFVLGWTEVLTDFRNIGGFGYSAWLLLALIFFAGADENAAPAKKP